MYIGSKSIGRTQRGVKKPRVLLTVTADQWESVLQAIEDDTTNLHQIRDYALVFLGAALGMRRGEICLYERKHFRDLDKYDVIYVPTLKQSEKIQFTCQQRTVDGDRCGRKCRVKLSSAGQKHRCFRCGKESDVPDLLPGQTSEGVVEVPVDIVEPQTVGFIFDYLENHMRPDQRFLFETKPGYHISAGHVNRIFNTYSVAAGLDPKISFHSLRHNRGVKLYTMFKDMKLCQNGLRHKNIATTQIYADLDQEAKDHYREELAKKAFDPLKKRRKQQGI